MKELRQTACPYFDHECRQGGKKGRVETALHAIKDAGGIQAKPEKSLKSIQARQMQVKPAKESGAVSNREVARRSRSRERERGRDALGSRASH